MANRSNLQPEADPAKLREMMSRIREMKNEYRRRIQNPSGNVNKKQSIKQYVQETA
jgi:hypothetical protein